MLILAVRELREGMEGSGLSLADREQGPIPAESARLPFAVRQIIGCYFMPSEALPPEPLALAQTKGRLLSEEEGGLPEESDGQLGLLLIVRSIYTVCGCNIGNTLLSSSSLEVAYGC